MSFSLLSKCLLGVSAAGVASFFPIYFSLGGATSNSQNVVSVDRDSSRSGYQDRVTTTQERKEADQKHDDCLGQKVKLRIRNPKNHQEEKEVTLSEYTSKYSGWEALDADYKPQCSRELPDMQ